jgi:hypothetical protein
MRKNGSRSIFVQVHNVLVNSDPLYGIPAIVSVSPNIPRPHRSAKVSPSGSVIQTRPWTTTQIAAGSSSRRNIGQSSGNS